MDGIDEIEVRTSRGRPLSRPGRFLPGAAEVSRRWPVTTPAGGLRPAAGSRPGAAAVPGGSSGRPTARRPSPCFRSGRFFPRERLPCAGCGRPGPSARNADRPERRPGAVDFFGERRILVVRPQARLHVGQTISGRRRPAPRHGRVVSPWTRTQSGRSVSSTRSRPARTRPVNSPSRWSGRMTSRSYCAASPKKSSIGASISRCWEVMARTQRNSRRRRRNSSTTGASLMASGRVPSTTRTFCFFMDGPFLPAAVRDDPPTPWGDARRKRRIERRPLGPAAQIRQRMSSPAWRNRAIFVSSKPSRRAPSRSPTAGLRTANTAPVASGSGASGPSPCPPRSRPRWRFPRAAERPAFDPPCPRRAARGSDRGRCARWCRCCANCLPAGAADPSSGKRAASRRRRIRKAGRTWANRGGGSSRPGPFPAPTAARNTRSWLSARRARPAARPCGGAADILFVPLDPDQVFSGSR